MSEINKVCEHRSLASYNENVCSYFVYALKSTFLCTTSSVKIIKT